MPATGLQALNADFLALLLPHLVRLYKAFRGLLVSLVILIIAIPVALYIILSSDWAHQRIRQVGESELSNLFGTEVKIGGVNFSPFNRLSINDVSIKDDMDSTAINLACVDTRFELWDFVFRRKIIIDYATIKGLDINLYRDSIVAPLNIDGIISRLSRPDTGDNKSLFNLRLNDLSIEDCCISYDVISEPQTPQKFNPSHIHISDLSLSAFAPLISNDDYQVRLRSLNFKEESGFGVKDLSFKGQLTQHSITVNDLKIELPHSALIFEPLSLPIDSIKGIGRIIQTDTAHIVLTDASHVFLPDICAFVPVLEHLDYDVDMEMDVYAAKNGVDIDYLRLADAKGIFNADLSGKVRDFADVESLSVADLEFEIKTDTTAIANVLQCANTHLKPNIRAMLGNLGYTEVKGKADGSISDGLIDINVDSRLALANIHGTFARLGNKKSYNIDAVAEVDSLMLGVITSNKNLDRISGVAKVNGDFTMKSFAGDVDADISLLDFKGYRYHDISVSSSLSDDNMIADARISDPNLSAVFMGNWHRGGDKMHSIQGDLAVQNMRLDTLGLSKAYPGYTLSCALRVDATGESIDKFRGNLELSNLALFDAGNKGARLRNLEISADNLDRSGRIVVVSDVLNGEIDGAYNFSSIAKDVRKMYHALIPALVPNSQIQEIEDTYRPLNNFAFDFTIEPCEDLCSFLKLPISVVNPILLSGFLNSKDGTFHLVCDTPWLVQGSNGYYEDPDLVIDLDTYNRMGNVFFVCRTPTKKGMMELSAHIEAVDGLLDNNILWTLIREKPINGNIPFTTLFSRDEHDHLVTKVNFKPGKINFGNEIWNIHESEFVYVHDKGIIRNFSLSTDEQSINDEPIPGVVPLPVTDLGLDSGISQAISINGILGDSDEDRLTVDLRNIQLINIFETLEIDNALISGYATGTVNTSALLSKNPVIDCEKMTIRSVGYNYCTLGDAVAHLGFDDGGKIFRFSANVSQPGGYKSSLKGFIEPATEGIELNIDADHIKVGFMKPFMSAFTSDVKGFASGRGKLYGTFSDIDMTGDIYVDSLDVKIDFTNTWYHATDSIHIRPGIIKLDDIVLRDDYGNTALLNGWVGHHYFHNASFDFNITDARNFLCYDVPENNENPWYGKIFGDGAVTVKGHPGIVDIKAHVTTSPHSTFTFVLSDQEVADEYSFITFRDVTPKAPTDSILDKNTTPDLIREIIKRNNSKNQDVPTNYIMDLEVSATPQAQLVIVMDPVGGDRIRSNGSGDMRMIYKSVDNDLRLYGKYTLEKGNYNFTLQDIIRKDFTIKEGSTINFSGDPYRAELDIDAYATINANLSDLDESFLQDKELNRTNVPVRALLLVRGDMLQPNISFDLEFPTLTQDTYRKVKSIVSTEDMMSKQIIYLLVLNRFYTPEYMASTTKGNELFSVASSTLASQLSNMLGKLSENWSIAPNLRSDRGDFSDIEVDLTLSSSLLNNRLLFNGNFGYRDKSLNTNQFVGDFDLEYLLNHSGEWRLKAYNRYNDQNYYLRTAQTTQGVGIVYRKDFDSSLRFLKNLWPFRSKDTTSVPTDTIIENINIKIIPDSISQ